MSARSSESGERARRYLVAEKLRLVEETAQPGASVSLVARRHDINANMLFTWRRQARQGLLAAPPAADATAAFVPMGVIGGSAPPIEIELPNGVRLRLGGEVDGGSLRRLLTVLKETW
jgi:transposase